MNIVELKDKESLIVNHNGVNVKITLLPKKIDCHEQEFTFGIDAPRSVAINREEVLAQKIRNGQYKSGNR